MSRWQAKETIWVFRKCFTIPTVEQIEEYFLNGILEMIDVSPSGEMLYNEYVKIKICQRLLLGWNEIYNDSHFSENQEQMVHPFSCPHQIDQVLLVIHNVITPHQLREQILRLFERYSPQEENITDYLSSYLGPRYGQEFLSSDDEDLDDEDVDNEPSPQPFMNLQHVFQAEIKNAVNKIAPAA